MRGRLSAVVRFMESKPAEQKRVLVTGATGYVGGRLIPRLLERGYRVRVLARDARRIEHKPWATRVEVFEGDLLKPESLAGLGEDIDCAFYLVHSMNSSGDGFARQDAAAALNFATHAPRLKHVVYLGGLAPEQGASAHLDSRAEVGAILREKLPTTEFRAGPIIGSGSASFEMVRYLTERLPAMVAPRWIRNRVSPISIRDIVAYLLRALDVGASGVVEVGAEALTFKQMMLGYARLRGLRRLIVPVPVLAPKLAARWVGFVTPIPNYLAVPIIAGMTQELVADTRRAGEIFPDITPSDYYSSVSRALSATTRLAVETRWSDSLGGSLATEFIDREGLYREHRSTLARASATEVWAVITSLGGDRGWLFWNPLWRIRGLLDRLAGGPGLRRGRRHPTELRTGDSVDFWRVEQVDHCRSLTLRAEMRLPGRAWMRWETAEEADGARVTMSAFFEPHGLPGVLYWKALGIVHRFMFTGMIRRVAKQAAARPESTPVTQT